MSSARSMTARNFGFVEQLTLAMNKQKDLLDQIIGLCDVSENSESDRTHSLRIATKERGERFSVPLPESAHQCLVRGQSLVQCSPLRLSYLPRMFAWHQASVIGC